MRQAARPPAQDPFVSRSGYCVATCTVAITRSLTDSYCCQNSASPRSRWIAINNTLPQGPARRGFGFLSPPAPRACLGRTRVVPNANAAPVSLADYFPIRMEMLRSSRRRALGSARGIEPRRSEVKNMEVNQFKEAREAPIMVPGFSKLPLCKITATASTPSNFIASIGTVKFSLFPLQLPSLIHRRTTLV